MGRQRNTQEQVRDRSAEILDTARAFASQPERFEWLRALLASRSLDSADGILVELRSVPDQDCWVHYGIWLTSSGTFLRFVADEAFGEKSLHASCVLQDSSVEDVTEQTVVARHVPGVGSSFGWLALDALRLLGMTKPSQATGNGAKRPEPDGRQRLL
jgi:hypothetical protein